MSKYDWERGEVLLPTAAVGPMKQQLRKVANDYHEAVYATCLRLWAGPLGKFASQKVWSANLDPALRALPDNAVSEAVASVLYRITDHWGQGRTKPHKPTRADVDREAPRATVRTVTFGENQEWGIHLEGTELRYRSGENNHQVERARAEPVVAAMFRMLEKVAWTRGSGGTFTGNDEYNRDDHGAGGGGNYVTAAYGPRGEAERAYQMGMSVERYRKIMAAPAPGQRRW